MSRRATKAVNALAKTVAPALLALIALATSPSGAQADTGPEDSESRIIEVPLEDGPFPTVVVVDRGDPELREAALFRVFRVNQRGARQELWDAPLPEFLFRDDRTPEIEVEWLEVRGAAPIYHLRFIQLDELDEREQASVKHWLLPPRGLGNRTNRFGYLWSTRRSGIDTGDRLSIVDLNDDGRDVILLSLKHDMIRWCGDRELPLAPRVFDTRAQIFRPISIAFDVGDDAVELPRSDEPIADHFQLETPLEWVSSNDERGVYPNHGRVPDGLRDGMPDTGWIEGGVGTAGGQFLSGTVRPGFRLVGVSVRTGIDGVARAPEALMLSIADGREFILRPEPGEVATYLLPEPVQTSCFTITMLEPLNHSREPAGLSLVRMHTDADLLPLSQALSEIALPALYERLNTIDERTYARIISNAGSQALPYLMDEIARQTGPREAALVRPISQIPDGIEQLAAWFARAAPGTATAREFGRFSASAEHDPTNVIIVELLRAENEENQERLLRIVSRSIDPQRAMLLLRWVNDENPRKRAAARDGLTRLETTGLSTLYVYASTLIEDRPIGPLRAASALARGNHREDLSISDDARVALEELTTRENGTVARLAIANIGFIADENLRPLVEEIATSDPHPYLRAQAYDALPGFSAAHPHLRGRIVTMLAEEGLRDPHPTVRIAAARELHRMRAGEEASATILDRLGNETWPEARRPMLQALLDACDEDIDEAVTPHFAGSDLRETRTVIRMFQNRTCAIPHETVEMIASRWDDRPSVLASLVQVVARVGTRESDPWLLEMLRSHPEDPSLRRVTIEAAGRRGLEEAREDLLAFLDDESAMIRRATARALAYSLETSVIDALRSALETEEDHQVRRAMEMAVDSVRTNISVRDLMY